MPIKTAHEAPIQILDSVAEITDYSYALVHLFESHPEYLFFFKNQLEAGREVILDNSIFELGTAFDRDRYAYWINKLRPTEYIIPDSLEDVIETKAMASNWIEDYGHLNDYSKSIGVVQGRTYYEIVECYDYLDNVVNVDKIAISFDYSYYLRNSNIGFLKLDKSAKLAGWMLGRISLMERLLADGVINKDKPHHLLGCSLPQEFKHYVGEKWDWIESMDSSNPVVAGLQLKHYDDYRGLSDKPSIKLFELIDVEVSPEQWRSIALNISNFRQNLR